MTYENNGNYSIAQLLYKGDYQVSWAFYKGSNRNEKNVFNLYSLIISGSNLGGSSICKECPEVLI